MQRWEVVRVYRADLNQPHDKFCICVDYAQRWFLYFNSERPGFRKAREVAVEVSNHEVLCLNHTSFVDTTYIVDDIPENALQEALADDGRCHGMLSQTVRQRICEAINWHGALSAVQRAAFVP